MEKLKMEKLTKQINNLTIGELEAIESILDSIIRKYKAEWISVLNNPNNLTFIRVGNIIKMQPGDNGILDVPADTNLKTLQALITVKLLRA